MFFIFLQHFNFFFPFSSCFFLLGIFENLYTYVDFCWRLEKNGKTCDIKYQWYLENKKEILKTFQVLFLFEIFSIFIQNNIHCNQYSPTIYLTSIEFFFINFSINQLKIGLNLSQIRILFSKEDFNFIFIKEDLWQNHIVVIFLHTFFFIAFTRLVFYTKEKKLNFLTLQQI